MKHTEVLKANGFKAINVSDEEVEDGVGTRPGMNFVKDAVWYTYAQACEACGIEKTTKVICKERRTIHASSSEGEVSDEQGIAQNHPKLEYYTHVAVKEGSVKRSFAHGWHEWHAEVICKIVRTCYE